MSKRFVFLDALLVPVVLFVGVELTEESLGLASIDSQIRLTLQALMLSSAVLLVIQYPANALVALQSNAVRWLLALGIFAFLSTGWSVTPSRTLSQGASVVALSVVAFMHVSLRGWQWTRAVLTRLFLGLLILGAAFDIVVEVDAPRWQGFMASPTELAMFATFTTTLAFMGWRSGTEASHFTAFIAAFCMALTLLSHSRVATLILVLVILHGVSLRAPRGNRAVVLFGVAATAMTVAVTLSSAIWRFTLRDGATTDELAAVNGRASFIWPYSIEAIQQRPWFGHGFSTGLEVYLPPVLNGEALWHASNAHNVVLEIATGLGLIGLFLLFGFVIATVRERSGRRAGVNVILLVVFAIGITDGVLMLASSGWLVLALAAGASIPMPGSPTLRTGDPMQANRQGRKLRSLAQ